MIVLGWHGSWSGAERSGPPRALNGDFAGHDSAAAILNQGVLVAAVEEERLNRVKHSRNFPVASMRYCMKVADIGFEDVDLIAVDVSEEYLDAWVFRQAIEDPGIFPSTGRELVSSLFHCEFGVDPTEKLRFCRHHHAHAHAAFHGSGFSEALVVCLDGLGDGPSGLIAKCGPTGLRILRSLTADQSLGYFYVRSIALVGYSLFDEYKVMGLAPYGDASRYRDLFARLYRLLPEGRYELVQEAERRAVLEDAGLLDEMRKAGEPFTQLHRDYSAALQEALEIIVSHVVRYFATVEGSGNLCLGGGVAHNCSMNGRLIRSGIFQRVYVQPAAHDAGNAIGAALSVQPRTKPSGPDGVMPHVYWGPELEEENELRDLLAKWAGLLDVRQVDDPAEEAAALIADGEVIGWVQGRSEFGPRALGNRSILADPRPSDNKRIINSMVKKRESYRPFAPSVLESEFANWFEAPAAEASLAFMTYVVPVQSAHRSTLGAITHVDGTARVQTVSAKDNPLYHRLISAFWHRTGIPMVLNTSFNNNVEPIVNCAADAIACFLTTGIDRLVIGNNVVTKSKAIVEASAFGNLRMRLAAHRRLVTHRENSSPPCHFIEATADTPFPGRPIMVSAEIAEILRDPRERSLDKFESSLDADQNTIRSEMFALWEQRVVDVSPR